MISELAALGLITVSSFVLGALLGERIGSRLTDRHRLWVLEELRTALRSEPGEHWAIVFRRYETAVRWNLEGWRHGKGN